MSSIAMINGRAVRLVPNTHPDLAIGIATRIYQDPVTRSDCEGVAVIREIDRDRSDEWFLNARVEFTDEPGQSYWRAIYRKETEPRSQQA